MNIYYWEKIGDKQVNIVMRRRDKILLTRRHFRGKDIHLASNFLAWNSIDQLFEDLSFLRALYEDARDAFESGHLGENSFTFDNSRIVGWSFTDSINNYHLRDLTPFTFDQKFHPYCSPCTIGLMLKKKRWYKKAPYTKLITVVYEIKDEVDKIVLVIRDMYPGQDYGDQSGDISRREGLVFFHRHHPGE